MKKRLLGFVLAMTVVMTTLLIPVSVSAADFSTYSDFEDYVGGWDGVENFNTVLPAFPNVSASKVKASPSKLDAYSGITNGTASDNKYGNSLKIVCSPNESATSAVGTYAFINQEMEGSIYLQTSICIEKSQSGKYSAKSLRLNGDAGTVYPVHFNEAGAISVFGGGTGKKWEADEWYDVNVWYNMDTGAYIVKIYNDGATVVDTFGLTTAIDRMTRFIFYNNHNSKHAVLIAAGTQVTYFDNFRLENTDKVIIDEMQSLTHYTFDEWDEEAGLPSTLGKGVWKKGLSGSGAHPVEQIKTDRGYSAKVCALNTEDINNITGYKNDYLNPALFMNYGTNITTTAALKVSFMLPDDNYGTFNVKMANSITALTANHGSSIYGMNYRDTGLKTKLNTWYDLEVQLDFDTGYYYYCLTDGITEYRDSGFSKEAIALTEAKLYRTWFRITSKIEGRYNEPSAFIIDDFYYGPVSKLTAPVCGGKDLTAEEKKSIELPFKNTKFRYTADVDINDLSTDTILTANGTRTINKVLTEFDYQLVKFGADGKLYIGETAVADANAGRYSVEALVDQQKYSADVKVSKNGMLVAEVKVALGNAAILMEKINWAIGDNAIGDVEYRTVYDFALDNANSSKGTVKASEAIVARFSNALDKTSFNAESVKINDGAITPEITFIDDNTARIDFAKNPGEVYTIKFTDVNDMFGNSVSDYIRVTMDDEADVYLTDVSFTKEGNVIEITEPGKINATISAAAYGGNEDITFVLALYEGGRMTDCDFESFSATKNLTTKVLEVEIPDDGKHYVLKAYVNNADTLEPYMKPAILTATNLPVVILKLDGVGTGTRYTSFLPAYQYAVENGIKMNFGVMAWNLDSDSEEVALLDEMENHEMIEFWNHQYDTSVMNDNTREEIFADFENAKVVSEKTGVVYETFNSRENYIHYDIADAADAYNYKAILSRATEPRLAYYGYLDPDRSYVTLWKTFDVEDGVAGSVEGVSGTKEYTVCLPVEDLVDPWADAKHQQWPYVVLQYHPCNWPASDLTDANGKVYSSDFMYDFIEYLEAEGAIFMTSTEYVDYASVIQ